MKRSDPTFYRYVAKLSDTNQDKVDIPKREVPELPEVFEEHYPANGMQDDGAQASYRDDEAEQSLHVIAFEDYWEVHIDDHNPNHAPIKHLVNDAPGAAALLVIVFAIVYRNYQNSA